MQNLPAYFPSFMWGNGSGTGSHNPTKWETLSPQPVPGNLCELRSIIAEIFCAVDQSPYLSHQVKADLRECKRQLDAECAKLAELTQLARRAATDAENVMRSRVNFFEAVDGRILELSQIRARFVDSRQIFREQPNKLLTQGIQDAKGHVHEGYLSSMRPLFDKIDKYYREVNVSLRVEEECLKKIRSSFRVTPDNKFRWEYIRDACREASALLISETPPLPPYMPEPITNKAARNINVLAQTVTEARHSLRQTHRNIADLTQHPQFGLLRLQTEYKNSEQTCREKIDEVLQFSESFLRSFVEVPPLDDFRDYLLPSAAASSLHILQEVGKQVGKNAPAVLSALPQLKSHFARFNQGLPIANASMQSTYRSLQGIVRPLEQPNDPHYGVLRTMKPVQLGEDQRNWGGLSEQWQHSYSTFRPDNVFP